MVLQVSAMSLAFSPSRWLLPITRDARGRDVWYLSLPKMVLPDKTVTETTSNFPHYADWLYSNLTS